jgi:hypothetical protein
MYVWVLVIYMSGSSHNGGPTVIDNIATREECVRVQEIFFKTSRGLDIYVQDNRAEI